MSAVGAGIMAFLCAFGGMLGGMVLRPRLPQSHLEAESRDAIRLAMATVATLTALVVGLLIASAKQSFDERTQELKHAAVQSIMLDRSLEAFGPSAIPARTLLRTVIRDRIAAAKGAIAATGSMPPAAVPIPGAVQAALLALKPETEDQHWLKQKALETTADLARTRWLLAEPGKSEVQWPFLIIVMFWLAAMFMSFGLFAPRNASVLVAMFVTALSIAGSITVILEMDTPYGGLVRISDAPMVEALAEMGEP